MGERKLKAILKNADRFINWYEKNKPEGPRRLAVSKSDYTVLEAAVHTAGVWRDAQGLHYWDFLLYAAEAA